ncbi:MAG: hypothetical protein L6R39_004788 [Caloplaca ligustica]|nr:MAG: hypothetical protein L6R39_004788 [Caloplaca ligustica]
MVPEPEKLLSLSNPLATVEQLSTSSSSLNGVPAELESSIRLAGLEITQTAGILLQLPQEIIVQAMVLFTRFYLGPEGGSYRTNSAKVGLSSLTLDNSVLTSRSKDVSAASLYMAAKLSANPQTPRSVCNVYAYLMSEPTRRAFPKAPTNDPESYYLSEGNYHAFRAIVLQTEIIVLRTLSFDVKTVVPHHLALTYLQTLGVLPSPPSSKSRTLAARTLGYLNVALLSPQLLYVIFQPTALAVAAIYLASREAGVKLPSTEWWEVYDVDREDLGFLVVAFRSCEPWIKRERENWKDRKCPLTVDELEAEMKHESI